MVALHTGVHAIANSRAAICHLPDMYRRQLSEEKARCKFDRPANRLVNISAEIQHLSASEK